MYGNRLRCISLNVMYVLLSFEFSLHSWIFGVVVECSHSVGVSIGRFFSLGPFVLSHMRKLGRFLRTV